MTLTLQSGAWKAELRPEIGGCIASLTRDGVEVLRTMPAGSAEPLESACIPLVPYCNRIRDARFVFQTDEDDPLCGTRPLTTDDISGDSH